MDRAILNLSRLFPQKDIVPKRLEYIPWRNMVEKNELGDVEIALCMVLDIRDFEIKHIMLIEAQM